jgi:hypothetical protein
MLQNTNETPAGNVGAREESPRAGSTRRARHVAQAAHMAQLECVIGHTPSAISHIRRCNMSRAVPRARARARGSSAAALSCRECSWGRFFAFFSASVFVAVAMFARSQRRSQVEFDCAVFFGRRGRASRIGRAQELGGDISDKKPGFGPKSQIRNPGLPPIT